MVQWSDKSNSLQKIKWFIGGGSMILSGRQRDPMEDKAWSSARGGSIVQVRRRSGPGGAWTKEAS